MSNVYSVNLNEIYNMDCMEGMKQIPRGSIDLVVIDPPYRFENKGGGFFADNNSTQRQYLDSLGKINCTEFEPLPFLEALHPKMKKFYGYFFCNRFLIEEYIKFARDYKYNFDVMVMAKLNPIPAYSNHHLSDLEYIVMIREPATYFSKHQNLDDFRKFYLTNCQTGRHPAEKPVELLERFIRVSSVEGNVVLDPFAGSGSTALACLKNNRNYIGFEIEKKYFNLAVGRLDDYKNQLNLW